jgi:hypothetical protein
MEIRLFGGRRQSCREERDQYHVSGSYVKNEDKRGQDEQEEREKNGNVREYVHY